jgi:aspartyl-tRNA synthetase
MCGHVGTVDIGAPVRLQGWVWRRRDLGGLIFIDLRDRSGVVQCVFNPEDNPDAHGVAHELRPEWVVEVEGQVEARPEEMVNDSLATGALEIKASAARVLARSETPPFLIEEDSGASEELRLRYRYLDLRRPPLQRTLALRHRLALATRNFLDERGFLEVETPVLTRTTPEGARDYLVPSRLQAGQFYALPQSPQLFKQLLMIGGFDRYFQIARCFRDEDLRANRQPEFTQIDMEMAFVEPEDVMEVSEGLLRRLLEVAGLPSEMEIERLSFRQALDRFGSDRPDMRYAHELSDVTDLVRNGEFRAFAEVAAEGGSVKALRFPGGAEATRSQLDKLSAIAQEQGAKGLVWILNKKDGFKSPVAKFLGDEMMASLAHETSVVKGDALLLVADEWEVAATALGSVRSYLAETEGWIEPGLKLLWVNEFPLLERDRESGRLVARHHPFTAPLPDDLGRLEESPLSVRAQSYDLVLNGVELGGGSIRNHDVGVQGRVFEVLGIGAEEARAKFGFLLDALSFGAPPHGGIAFGYDRIVMTLAGLDSIRHTIAFPKTTRAADLMMDAPAAVDEEQLAALHLSVVNPEPESSED